MSLSRRALLVAPLVLAALPARARPVGAADARARLAGLEREYGGRLGVAILDTATGQLVQQRGDERFPLCSTFKFLAAAFVLARVDQGKERLDRRVAFTGADLLSWSPVTRDHVAEGGMSLEALCAAAITHSDNTAANLLLASFGGPAGLTGFARGIGDDVTRLDRTEPALNEARPGDPRDTTTPAAMAENMRRLVLGDALTPASRARLTDWLMANTTGDTRIRAGLPGGWRAGDKTGTSGTDVSNDVAVAWPPGRAPVIISAYFAESGAPGTDRDTALAEVGRVAAMMIDA